MTATAADHIEQSEPNGCVAACIAMVRRAQGRPFTDDDQARIMALGNETGVHLGVAGVEVDGCRGVMTTDEFLAQAPLWLADGRWLIVMVSGPPYVHRRGTTPGGRPSRHGDLCAPQDREPPYPPFHAVVLTERDDDGYVYLDPYYPADGQPLRMTDDDLVATFSRQFVVTPAIVR
jgi:hypothetical protein